ncbi:MAG: group II intron maturase-specific domain-containing protein, partial [Gemmatimonadaceae bacterium]
MDKELERRGHRFARYADDCNVYVRSERAGKRVMEALVGLYAKLRLQVNVTKSAVAPARQRPFLGFCFWTAPGHLVKRRLAPESLTRMKSQVRQMTRRAGGRSMRQVIAELRGYLVGWHAYFRLAETPNVFTTVDQWVHRRLRALQLKQWRNGTTVYRELRARDVPERVARAAAAHTSRWWRT